ncbi:hypothetical protein [Deinococcus sp. RM]|uniref:hypothetical protein n=1 Tax=Deinococcus sp. RM TaxID=2316359 RepID=UPI000E685D99|nr:hypothetical protein [Deinococcus sp. RM]RIY15576.1 hypothetical protein D3W47_01665 [Deinococcus sp. RM]
MPHRPHIQDPAPLHDQVGRLYFQVVLPAVMGALTLSSGGQDNPVLPLLTVLAGLGAALHLLLPARLRDAVRYGFAVTAIAFVLGVAAFGHLPALRGTPAQLSVALLFTPATLMAWTLLFADRPRTALALNVTLTSFRTRWPVTARRTAGAARNSCCCCPPGVTLRRCWRACGVRSPRGSSRAGSAGLTRRGDGEDLARAFERADSALRAAKDAGRDRVVLAAPGGARCRAA